MASVTNISTHFHGSLFKIWNQGLHLNICIYFYNWAEAFHQLADERDRQKWNQNLWATSLICRHDAWLFRIKLYGIALQHRCLGSNIEHEMVPRDHRFSRGMCIIKSQPVWPRNSGGDMRELSHRYKSPSHVNALGYCWAKQNFLLIAI